MDLAVTQQIHLCMREGWRMGWVRSGPVPWSESPMRPYSGKQGNAERRLWVFSPHSPLPQSLSLSPPPPSLHPSHCSNLLHTAFCPIQERNKEPAAAAMVQRVCVAGQSLAYILREVDRWSSESLPAYCPFQTSQCPALWEIKPQPTGLSIRSRDGPCQGPSSHF